MTMFWWLLAAVGIAAAERPNPEFGRVYVDDTLGVGVGIDQGWPDRPGDIPFGGGGFHSIVMIENTNHNVQVVTQRWSNDTLDDRKTTWVDFVTMADSARPHSRNGGIRVDAINNGVAEDGGSGPCTGILVNIGGVNANLNRGFHAAIQRGSNAYAFVATNPEFGGEDNPCWSVDRRGTLRSEQQTEIEQRIAALEKKVGLPSSTKSWWHK